MTLPTTPGSSLSLNQVNVELGFGGSTTISLQDTAVRSLFARTTVSSSISFSDGSNKTNIKYTGANGYAALANNDTIVGPICGQYASGDTGLNFKTNGQVDWFLGNLATTELFNTWGVSGITSSNFYIRFTRTATLGSLDESTASTGWLQMTQNRPVSVSTVFGDSGSATYTIEIAGGSGGTPLLSTRTGIVLEVFNECQGG